MVAAAGPRAWIDFPRDSANIPAGASVIVISHAYAPSGVAEVLLSVNGTAYRRDTPADAGAPLVEVRQEWMAQQPGLYTLQVTGYDLSGAAGSPDTITVRVTGEATAAPTGVPPPTAVPTDVPTVTPVPTEAPTATPIPTLPPTVTPVPTARPTAIPPAQVSFWVDDDSITAGECTTLRWDVQNATAVYLDGAGVPGQATRAICPTSTTTYNLHVEAPGGNVDRSVTVTVSAPADATPPAVPSPAVPANGLVLTCRSKQVLAWLPVSDPSGVVYYVKLEYQKTATEWQVVGGYGPLMDKQVEVKVDCGIIYRWAVRAQDGAGNTSDWSAWSGFSINLK